jgi:peptidoglycan/LPS O-acetylase OafA/YrhL
MSVRVGVGEPSGRIDRLDGIRAVAIILVFLIHVNIGRFGWEGVPLFFVLSGFLITTILRRSRTNESFWGPFYIKRATRILPPLAIAFLLAVLFSTVAWRKVGLYEVLFLANFATWLHPDGTASLTVLWSLAVEEQFYLFWPFAVRYLNRRQLMWLSACVLIVEPILRAIVSPFCNTSWPIYYLTPFQLDGLALDGLPWCGVLNCSRTTLSVESDQSDARMETSCILGNNQLRILSVSPCRHNINGAIGHIPELRSLSNLSAVGICRNCSFQLAVVPLLRTAIYSLG